MLFIPMRLILNLPKLTYTRLSLQLVHDSMTIIAITEQRLPRHLLPILMMLTVDGGGGDADDDVICV